MPLNFVLFLKANSYILKCGCLFGGHYNNEMNYIHLRRSKQEFLKSDLFSLCVFFYYHFLKLLSHSLVRKELTVDLCSNLDNVTGVEDKLPDSEEDIPANDLYIYLIFLSNIYIKTGTLSSNSFYELLIYIFLFI